jgi:hypothetical protein
MINFPNLNGRMESCLGKDLARRFLHGYRVLTIEVDRSVRIRPGVVDYSGYLIKVYDLLDVIDAGHLYKHSHSSRLPLLIPIS